MLQWNIYCGHPLKKKTGAQFNFPSDATPAQSAGGWILRRKQGPNLISHQMLPLHNLKRWRADIKKKTGTQFNFPSDATPAQSVGGWILPVPLCIYLKKLTNVMAGGPMLIICRHRMVQCTRHTHLLVILCA